MKTASPEKPATSSYFQRLRQYDRKPSFIDPALVAYAEDMDNWSALREEQEDVATRSALRHEVTERKASA